MANFALAAILNISAILNFLTCPSPGLQKYIMKSVLTIIAYGMTFQTLPNIIPFALASDFPYSWYKGKNWNNLDDDGEFCLLLIYFRKR
jgi:hypothetical protein